MRQYISLLLLLISLCFTACEKNEFKDQLTKTITVGNNIELSVPEELEFNQLQGQDSYVAEIIDPNISEFKILIDIGQLAGHYVDKDGTTAVKLKSENETFWFEDRDSQYWGSDDCCLFFTFPDLGPANFIARNNEHKELVIAIIHSLRSI